MLQKLNSRRGGFTLVEIMIVVAIIALLASIAVPNFMRARQRSQATACKMDAKMIDAAREQWAVEKNKKPSDACVWADLKPYVKDNSPLYANGGNDTLGNAITYTPLSTAVSLSATTKGYFSTDVADADFWSPY
ncbi:MAG: prepilin-type N-terminal cleavage/methylation domain-containing protein [Verrucomicrobia bacterium]|nr:prepilin-type N-terminal cleavage/methylation domain-containing protein [Verrucomicrobiota bacterium]